MSVTETRAFSANEHLLRDVIMRQAGSLDKAILEGAMNACDAGATMLTIEIERDRVRLKDDGHGFRSREDVIQCFEVFGKDENAKAVSEEHGHYAYFGMGRGQLMAHGLTTYRSGPFLMKTDVRQAASLSYELTDGLNDEPGCAIDVELYDALSAADHIRLVEGVAWRLKYLPLAATLNGRPLGAATEDVRWDYEDDDCFIRFNVPNNGLYIYNRGVLVEMLYSQRRKVGAATGTVVSKRTLQLNFARNEVMQSCPTWRRIRKALEIAQKSALVLKSNPTPEEVAYLVGEWVLQRQRAEADADRRAETDPDHASLSPVVNRGDVIDLRHCGLLKDTKGRRHTLAELIEDKPPAVAFDDAGSVLAEQAMAAGLALVVDLDFAMMAFAPVGPYGDFEELLRELLAWYRIAAPLVACDEIYASLDHDTITLVPSSWSPFDTCVVRALDEAHRRLLYGGAGRGLSLRTIVVGRSDSQVCWTDGGTFIAFDQAFLRDRARTLGGWNHLLILIADAYAARVREDGARLDRYHEIKDRVSLQLLANLPVIMTYFIHQLWKKKLRVTQKMRFAELLAVVDEKWPEHLVDTPTRRDAASLGGG